MFTVDLNRVLTTLVQAVLSPNSEQFRAVLSPATYGTDGLHVSLRFRVMEPHKENDDKERNIQTAYLHYIFSRSGNYVKVWCAEGTGRWPWEVPPAENFKMTCDHDTCWRNDGLRDITRIYFEMCKAVNANVAPISLDSEATLEKVQKVKIEFTRRSAGSYDSVLTKVETLR